MELTRLRHIVAVARNRSFSRAAEEEGITQPALSRSIAAFERRHDVTLFDRGRGGVYPTPAGTLVIEQASKLLAGSSELERSLKLYGRGDAGRVGVPGEPPAQGAIVDAHGIGLGEAGERGLADFDLVFSYTGGAALDCLRDELGARRVDAVGDRVRQAEDRGGAVRPGQQLQGERVRAVERVGAGHHAAIDPQGGGLPGDRALGLAVR